MNRLFTRLAFWVIAVLSTASSFAQSLSLDVGPTVVCFGKPLQVKAVLSGVSPSDVTAYRFDWGNGDSTVNFVGNPVVNFATKQYAAAGIYQITVTARFSNRGPLTASYWDTVYNLPTAAFSLTSLDSQCYTGNLYCFKEAALQGPAPSLPLTTRLFTYGDGEQDLVTSGETKCHNFGKGGVPFNVGFSVADAGGCAAQAFRSVYVGNDLRPRFAVSGNPRCDTTPYIFVNQTPVSPSTLQWFKWDFDDGTSYNSSDPIVTADLAWWSNFTHNYTKNGVFNPRLTVKGKLLNCTETFQYSMSGNQLPENIIIRYDLRSRRSPMNDTIADSVCMANLMQGGVCLYNVHPLQGVNTPIQILWDFADPNANPPGSDKFLNQAAPCYKYLGTGQFFPKLFVQCPGKPVKRLDFWSRISTPSASDTLYADPPIVNPRIYTINGYIFSPTDPIGKFRWIPESDGTVRDSITTYWKYFTDDSLDRYNFKTRADLVGFGVNILGPTVAIENPNVPIVIKPNLKVQCGPNFPVEFVNASSIYQSHNLYIRWEFGDNFAPRCTSFSVPDPSKPNGGMQPYTTAIDLANRTLPRFIAGGIIYPGGVNCNFSHDTLPIHRYENWRRIYEWHRFGHDYPPYDSSGTGWTKDPSQVAPNGKKLVAPLDASTWGLPMYSSGPTPSRIDTLDMWPQDLQPNRPITIRNGVIPDPIANYYGYWELTLPVGATVDTSGFIKQNPGGPNLVLPDMPNGMQRRYRGNTVIPGSNGLTMYEYFFNRVIQRCPNVTLLMKDSFNNQSADPIRTLRRINMNMTDSTIVINQRHEMSPGGKELILDTDTFTLRKPNPNISGAARRVKYTAKAQYDSLRYSFDYNRYYFPSDSSFDASKGEVNFCGWGQIVKQLADTVQYGGGQVIIPADSFIDYRIICNSGRYSLVYNKYTYELEWDNATNQYYIMFPEDNFHVDGLDCGGTSVVQLPLVNADAFGMGRTGKICPDLKSGQSGGEVKIEFGQRDTIPGTYPHCGGRTWLLLNYDSLADRQDAFPCEFNGFVHFDGSSSEYPQGTVFTTKGGHTWPPFNNAPNFNPLTVWPNAGGTTNITHYMPAGPWPYENSPKDPKGFVTIGVIIGTGCITNNDCSRPACLSDTVWYHKFLHLITLNATFTYRKVGGYNTYGVPSRLPSQDYTYDSAEFYPTFASGPLPNGNWREPWSRLYGKGDILEFETYVKQQDYVLADIWAWGDGIVTIDSFYTNRQDTFVKLDPVNFPNDSLFFEKHTFPINRLRFEVSTETIPFTVLSVTQPYPMRTNVYKGVQRDTIWECDDFTRTRPPQLIKVTNIFIDSAFILHPITHQYFMSSYEMPAGPGTTIKRNTITPVEHILVTTGECLNSKVRQLAIGVVDTFTVFEDGVVSDGILCVGQEVTFEDSIRYWFPKSFGANGVYGPSRPLDVPGDYIFPGGEVEIYNDNHGRAMNGYPNDTIKTFVNYSKYFVTTSATCPFGWVQSTSALNNTCYKIDTAFFERIYWDYNSDGVIDYAGAFNARHRYTQPGKYKVSMITRDTVGYYDTCFTFLNVVEPVAKFSSADVFNCDVPVQFFDSSAIIDGCIAETGFPCDQIDFRRWWFGDVGFDSMAWRSEAPNPTYAYKKNGWYTIMQVLKTQQGCYDTARKDIFLRGPRPRIKLLGDTLGCTPYKLKIVSYPNDSGVFSVTPATFIRPGRPDGAYETILLKNPDTVEVVYDYEGVYELTAVGYDTYPITNALCPPVVIPDTAGGEQRIKIYVKNPYKVEIESSKNIVCVGEPFTITNKSSMDTITKFRMYSYNADYSAILDTVFKTNFFQDTVYKYAFFSPGVYNLVMQSTSFIENTPRCTSRDTVTIRAMKAKAGLEIDSLGMPKYFIRNTSDSANASSYIWRIYNPDGTLKEEVIVPSNSDPKFNYELLDLKNDTGIFKVCIWAITAGLDYCVDSTCKEVVNSFTTSVKIPNVFTPNNDNKNDVFNIAISGEELYDLKIWNRWGGLVFESKDSKVMWNGRTQNVGEENPEGTYYFVFKYQLRGKDEEVVRGSITLLRE